MPRFLNPRMILPAGTLAVVGVAGLASQPTRAQVPPSRPAAASSATVEVVGNIEWIERAAVATKRPGVVQYIEMTLGMDAKKGDEIAFLDAEMAKLERDVKQLAAVDESGVNKAKAQRSLAASNIARYQRIRERGGPNAVSDEDIQTKEAEFKLADASLSEEEQKRKIAAKELETADRAVEEHIIHAPFDGEILDVLKQPGEAVQAMEPVVHMARTDMVRFFGYVPLEATQRLTKGMVVDVTPVIDGTDLAIEKQRFRGKLVFIGPELNTSRTKAEVQVKADIQNNLTKELRVGHKAEMTIYLDPAQAPPAPADMLPEKPKEARPELGINQDLAPNPNVPVQARAGR